MNLSKVFSKLILLSLSMLLIYGIATEALSSVFLEDHSCAGVSEFIAKHNPLKDHDDRSDQGESSSWSLEEEALGEAQSTFALLLPPADSIPHIDSFYPSDHISRLKQPPSSI